MKWRPEHALVLWCVVTTMWPKQGDVACLENCRCNRNFISANVFLRIPKVVRAFVAQFTLCKHFHIWLSMCAWTTHTLVCKEAGSRGDSRAYTCSSKARMEAEMIVSRTDSYGDRRVGV
ncbi:hypothetical protein HanXRQr2_Chr09g0377091 [Helianthus annuus]|uniref:Secreted protein n=1 Tax=Helianthus annuus TaxID=4232 RepID=A0A9K3I4L9_HELAN|nr:hypothetical protein HanXRQr2_Chr09g0377091 [Helianthus annuus]